LPDAGRPRRFGADDSAPSNAEAGFATVVVKPVDDGNMAKSFLVARKG